MTKITREQVLREVRNRLSPSLFILFRHMCYRAKLSRTRARFLFFAGVLAGMVPSLFDVDRLRALFSDHPRIRRWLNLSPIWTERHRKVSPATLRKVFHRLMESSMN